MSNTLPSHPLLPNSSPLPAASASPRGPGTARRPDAAQTAAADFSRDLARTIAASRQAAAKASAQAPQAAAQPRATPPSEEAQAPEEERPADGAITLLEGLGLHTHPLRQNAARGEAAQETAAHTRQKASLASAASDGLGAPTAAEASTAAQSRLTRPSSTEHTDGTRPSPLLQDTLDPSADAALPAGLSAMDAQALPPADLSQALLPATTPAAQSAAPAAALSAAQDALRPAATDRARGPDAARPSSVRAGRTAPSMMDSARIAQGASEGGSASRATGQAALRAGTGAADAASPTASLHTRPDGPHPQEGAAFQSLTAAAGTPSAALGLLQDAPFPLPGSEATAASAAGPHRGQLDPEVGSTEWQQALNRQILDMQHAGAQQAELQLNPAGLGPLKISLTLHEQQMQAQFMTAHAQVRDALEAALPQLREALQQGGIQLGQASVETGAQAQPDFAGSSGSERGDPRTPSPRTSAWPSRTDPASADAVARSAHLSRHGPGQRINTVA